MQVRDIISDKVKTLHEQYSAVNNPSADCACTQPQAKKKKEETVLSFLLGTEGDSDVIPSWQDEIDQFLRECQAHRDSDALRVVAK